MDQRLYQKVVLRCADCGHYKHEHCYREEGAIRIENANRIHSSCQLKKVPSDLYPRCQNCLEGEKCSTEKTS